MLRQTCLIAPQGRQPRLVHNSLPQVRQLRFLRLRCTLWRPGNTRHGVRLPLSPPLSGARQKHKRHATGVDQVATLSSRRTNGRRPAGERARALHRRLSRCHGDARDRQPGGLAGAGEDRPTVARHDQHRK